MHTLNKPKPQLKPGQQTWRNPTDKAVRFKVNLRPMSPATLVEVAPGETVDFPAHWRRWTINQLCKQLVPNEAKPEGDARRDLKPEKPEPPPPAAMAPLGDASKVKTPTELSEPEAEADHTANDALEAFASTLMKKPKAQLSEQAQKMGLAVEGEDGKPLAKDVIARAIALKSVQDGE